MLLAIIRLALKYFPRANTLAYFVAPSLRKKKFYGIANSFEAPFTLDELKKEYDDCYEFGFIMGCGHAQVGL